MRLTILDLVLAYNLALDKTFFKKRESHLRTFKRKSNPIVLFKAYNLLDIRTDLKLYDKGPSINSLSVT